MQRNVSTMYGFLLYLVKLIYIFLERIGFFEFRHCSRIFCYLVRYAQCHSPYSEAPKCMSYSTVNLCLTIPHRLAKNLNLVRLLQSVILVLKFFTHSLSCMYQVYFHIPTIINLLQFPLPHTRCFRNFYVGSISAGRHWRISKLS